MSSTPVVECVDLVKWFGGVQALRGVSMRVDAGTVVGLVGDNGAGKSTLVKILSGFHSPDGGEVRVAGRPERLTPASARAAGIETVYQDLALCDNLDAVANVLLGQEPIRFRLGPFRFIDRRKAERATDERIRAVGGRIPDLAVSVRRLSGGQRQAIAIARATVHAHRLMMLDEPTAALGLAQRRTTLEIIRGVAASGVGVLVISHNLDDVFAVCDRIVGLRLGEVTLDAPAAETTREEVIACMTTGRTHLGA